MGSFAFHRNHSSVNTCLDFLSLSSGLAWEHSFYNISLDSFGRVMANFWRFLLCFPVTVVGLIVLVWENFLEPLVLALSYISGLTWQQPQIIFCFPWFNRKHLPSFKKYSGTLFGNSSPNYWCFSFSRFEFQSFFRDFLSSLKNTFHETLNLALDSLEIILSGLLILTVGYTLFDFK